MGVGFLLTLPDLHYPSGRSRVAGLFGKPAAANECPNAMAITATATGPSGALTNSALARIARRANE
jgi:hypothetical protein